MAKLAIDRVSIVTCKKIGRFSFKIGRSGDFHYFIKNREISRKIGRLGSSEYVFKYTKKAVFRSRSIIVNENFEPGFLAFTFSVLSAFKRA